MRLAVKRPLIVAGTLDSGEQHWLYQELWLSGQGGEGEQE